MVRELISHVPHHTAKTTIKKLCYPDIVDNCSVIKSNLENVHSNIIGIFFYENNYMLNTYTNVFIKLSGSFYAVTLI